jgi:hypothetical protein
VKDDNESAHEDGVRVKAHVGELYYELAVRGGAHGCVKYPAGVIDNQVVPESGNEIVRGIGGRDCHLGALEGVPPKEYHAVGVDMKLRVSVTEKDEVKTGVERAVCFIIGISLADYIGLVNNFIGL